MQLYHLGTSRYARQLSGEGARMFGGRWNQQGDACIYTSGTRSLCMLEYLANVPPDHIPPELSITVYYLPDDRCRLIAKSDLPENWNEVPAPVSTKVFGSRLLADSTCICFAVPSVIVPFEWNYILNPAASDFSLLQIRAIEPFTVDLRIKK